MTIVSKTTAWPSTSRAQQRPVDCCFCLKAIGNASYGGFFWGILLSEAPSPLCIAIRFTHNDDTGKDEYRAIGEINLCG